MTKQDAAFYVHDTMCESVWHSQEPSETFYVVRNGEMRIQATFDTYDYRTIRYTSDLYDIGINNDQDLKEWTDMGEPDFSWHNNPWFEVYDENDVNFESEIFATLNEAIAFAKKKNGEKNG